MCQYITGILTPEGRPELVRRIAKGHLLRWDPLANRHVLKQLAAGETYYYTTRGNCDCGTALGSARREAISPEEAEVQEAKMDRKAAKLRRRGWSLERVQRWEEQIQKDRSPPLHDDRDPEAQRWIAFIREVIESGAARGVGLLLHWYNGMIESERIGIRRREEVAVQALDVSYLLDIEEDTLYVFRGRVPGTGRAR